MNAPALLDPFERETTLARDRVLSFSQESFEVPLAELLRHLAFDLVGAIPRPLGTVQETIPRENSPGLSFRSEFSQVGASVLALGTEIAEGPVAHRVLELLGLDKDLRVRLNMCRLGEAALAGAAGRSLAPTAREAAAAGRSLGQVHIWGNHAPTVEDVRRTLTRQLRHAGLEFWTLDRTVQEPTYQPPAAARLNLDAFPSDDLKVCEALLALLKRLPAEGAQRRAPRQIATHHVRERGRSTVSYHYETHRGGTGVLHMRRREVEAGLERPGLVRTFNVAGLRGAARLRIREVGGRASAEFAGSQAAVRDIAALLRAAMGGRA